jgi:outer membrane protein assembly factor BamB
VVAGDLVLGYGDGFLLAHRIADGKEVWRRTPERPVLGVIAQGRPRCNGGDMPEGIPINVVPGSSAAGAGMRTATC